MMNAGVRISKILVIVVGSEYSEKALKLACIIAAKCNAGLLIVNISEFLEREVVLTFDLSKKARQELEKGGNLPLLECCISEAEDAGFIDVQTMTTSGHAAEMILRIADLEGADMIVLGTRGLSSLKEFLLGSVSYNVSHQAKCSVVIAR